MLAIGRENEMAWECASELESTLVACFKLDMAMIYVSVVCVRERNGVESGEGWDVSREQKKEREKRKLLGG